MIPAFVTAWDRHRAAVREEWRVRQPEHYYEIVRRVVQCLATAQPGPGEWGTPDPDRITAIDHGDYQGTHVYVIGETGYQPSTYWYVRVSYGSCSGCDALEAARYYGVGPSPDDSLDQMMTLALHVVQRIKRMDGEAA